MEKKDESSAAQARNVPNTRLEELQIIKDRFPELYEPLCAAQQKAREALRLRSRAQKEVMPKEKDNKDQELDSLAHNA